MAFVIPIIEAFAGVIGWYEALFLSAVMLYGDYQRKKAEKAGRGLAGVSSLDRTQMVRAPAAPRVTLYGQSKISGVITYLKESDDHTYLHVLLTLTGHPVQEIFDIYLNDDILEEDAVGDVIGKYGDYVKIWRGLGTPASDAALLAELQSVSGGAWTTDHQQTGCAKLLVRLRFNHDLFPNGVPNVAAVVLGKLLYDPRTATTVFSNNPALAIRDYFLSADGIGGLSGEMDDDVFITAANICDEVVPLAGGHTSAFTVLRTDPPRYAAGSIRQWGAIKNGDLDPVMYNPNAPVNPFGSPTATIVYSVTFVDAAGETTAWQALDALRCVIPGGPRTNTNHLMRSVTLRNIPLGPSGTTARRLYRNGFRCGTLADNTTTTFSDDILNVGPPPTLIFPSPGTAAPSQNTTAIRVAVLSDNVYLPTGTIVRVASTTTLPAPLAAATDYYWIYLSRNRGAFATSLANAIAGTAIALTTTGTGTHTVTRESERRYVLDGTISADVAPRDVLRSMLTACAGELYPIGGKWKLYVGAYRAPTITLDENDLDGAVTTTTRLGRRTVFNGVKGVLFSPEDFWQQVDFPPVTNATYLAEDAGERIWSDVELPFTISKSMAQRIAKIKLEEARQQITTRWPCKLTALKAQLGDNVNLNFARNGWTAKPFKVADYQFAIRRDGDTPRFGIDVVLRETASAVYDWSSGEETVIDPAPDTDMPSPFNVPTPENLDIQSGTDFLLEQADGTIVSQLHVSWDLSSSEYVRQGGHVLVWLRPDGVAEWSLAVTLPGEATFANLSGVLDGALYFVAVQFVNVLGVHSDVVGDSELVVGKSEAPSDVTGFSASQNGNVVVFKWDQISDTDLAGYEIRYGPRGTTTWEDGAFVTRVTRGTQVTSGGVPPGDWTLMIKARDTSENYSDNEAAVDLIVTNELNVIAQHQQAPDWLGTRTHFVKHWTGVLIPDDQHPADYYTSFEWCDAFVPTPYDECSYEAPEFDIGFDDTARIWGSIDSALGPGVTSGIADPALEVDFHLAAGAYDGFEPWTIGDRIGRYFKHRLVLDTTDGKAKITGFLPTVDQLEHTESKQVTVAPGGSVITFDSAFHVAPNVVGIVVSGSALFATVTSITTTGFTAHIYNTAGSDVGGTLNYDATGV